MGNTISTETNTCDDVIFEVVENEQDKQLQTDNSILQNELIFKKKDLSNKILDNKKQDKYITKLQETIKDLEYKINIKENNNKIKINEINDLKEKYLEMLDYKENYENSKELNNKLECELKNYIVKDNDNINKINMLQTNLEDSKKYKKNYDKLHQEFNLLKINHDKLKREHQKLLNDNSLLINDVTNKLNNIDLKKILYEYYNIKLKLEPYINNIICDDIMNIFKNQISSLKLKYI